jgi:phosphate transport system substrate-binding protein
MIKSKRALLTLVSAALAATMLMPSTASAALVGNLKLSGSTTVLPVAQLLANKFHASNPSVKITVAGGGSGVGMADIAAGRVNIGMSSSNLTSAQLAKGLVPYAIARDALTIVVNPGNPVKKLTSAQVKAIYTGKITNWKQVGGPNAKILPAGRDGASGTFDYFSKSILLGARQGSQVKTYNSNGLVRNFVKANKYGIGYVGMAYVNSTVKALVLDNTAPTRANAMAGKYRYVRKLWFVTKGKAKGLALTFINYTLSAAGQKIVTTEYLPAK